MPQRDGAGAGVGWAASQWPVGTRQHVDLWLHGFAMLTDDATLVPFFKRGYRDRMLEVKRRANATTQLDVNRDQLRARFSANRALTSAQFLALDFSTWDSMLSGIDLFLRAQGDPRQGADQQAQLIIATFAQYFPTVADRGWLRLFTDALREENDKYYGAWWVEQQRELAPVVARVDTLWEGTYYAKFQGLLNHTGAAAGSFYLSLPLDGEGRTLSGTTRADNIITVALPETRDAAVEAIYVFAHEAVGRVVSTVVQDNTTPAERRSGLTDQYTGYGLVRGGALLVKRVAPELYEGYMRYYLRSANVAAAAGGAGLEGVFARTFPLPTSLADALARQLDVVLGGI
jgi:hypothetical protein